MHEMALSQSVADIVLRHAEAHGAERVRAVRLELGALSCAEPDALAFCFEAVTRGTLAEGAALEIAVVPGRAWCWDCDGAVELTDRAAGCPACGGFRLRVETGEDMRVKDLEIE
jgi:hydrogenase nickel incorporation protein HypA/HybF